MHQNVELESLKHQISISFLSGSPTSRSNWHSIKLSIESLRGLLPDEDFASIIAGATLSHPLAIQYPRNKNYVDNFILWLKKIWTTTESIGSHAFEVPRNTCVMNYEIGYNTYFLGEHSTPVSLLESCEGISRGTTGLRSWGAARVLASWCLDNSQLIKGRILELGSGIGFTAASILSSPQARRNVLSFTASDYHPHVLSILHHNLSLIKDSKSESSAARKKRLRFCSEINSKLSKDELEPGVFKEWPRMEGFQVENSLERTPTVEVRQIDWRNPCGDLRYDTVLAADVVYAIHLLPDLINVIKKVLTRESQVCDAPLSQSRNNKPTSDLNAKMPRRNVVNPAIPANISEPKAYIACTRRNQETIAEFFAEILKQNLRYKEIFQSTLDREESVFSFDESHLPIKIYEIFFQK